MDHNGFERQTQHFPLEGEQGGGSPGGQGAGKGGKRENRGREEGPLWGREAGAEIK